MPELSTAAAINCAYKRNQLAAQDLEPACNMESPDEK